MRALVLVVGFVVCVGACASPDSAPSIDHARPPWGPLTGGTTVELFGRNFDLDVNRVYIGGREAAVVRTIDDQHLEVVIPPGERAGDAEVVVVTPRDNVIATGVFRYSGPPVIESISPAKVLLSAPLPLVSIRGSGFVDEEAGDPVVLVDGRPILDITVRSDSLITFDAPVGIAFTRAEIQVINQRGSVSAKGFQYALTDHPGVLVYASSGEQAFGWFYEPGSGALLEIPRTGSSRPCIYAAMTAASGDHVASVYCTDFSFGRIDFESQAAVDLVPTNLYFAMTHIADTNYGIELNSRRFGTFSTDGTGWTPISQTSFSGNQFGLAADHGMLWFVGRDATFTSMVSTVDPETGLRGDLVPLSEQVDVYDMVSLDGVLYAPSSNGELVTIDPRTGTVTPLFFIGNAYAIDVIE